MDGEDRKESRRRRRKVEKKRALPSRKTANRKESRRAQPILIAFEAAHRVDSFNIITVCIVFSSVKFRNAFASFVDEFNLLFCAFFCACRFFSMSSIRSSDAPKKEERCSFSAAKHRNRSFSSFSRPSPRSRYVSRTRNPTLAITL